MYYREKWAVITPQSMYNESAKNIAGNLAQHPEQHIAVWRISDESTSSLMDQKYFLTGTHDNTGFLGICTVHTLLEKLFFSISPDNFPSSAFGTSPVHILVSAVYFSVFSLRMSWDWIFYCLHWLYTFWYVQSESIWGEVRNNFCTNASQLEWSLWSINNYLH